MMLPFQINCLAANFSLYVKWQITSLNLLLQRKFMLCHLLSCSVHRKHFRRLHQGLCCLISSEAQQWKTPTEGDDNEIRIVIYVSDSISAKNSTPCCLSLCLYLSICFSFCLSDFLSLCLLFLSSYSLRRMWAITPFCCWLYSISSSFMGSPCSCLLCLYLYNLPFSYSSPFLDVSDPFLSLLSGTWLGMNCNCIWNNSYCF